MLQEDEQEAQFQEIDETLGETVELNEVEEEVSDDEHDGEVLGLSEMQIDGETGEKGGQETVEIDLSNNSWTYFDKHQDSIFTIFQHPTLPMVVSGGGDNTAHMWTTHTQPPRSVGELSGHKESVICGGFTGDGRFVVTGDMLGVVQVHRAGKGGQKWTKFAEPLEEVEEVLWIQVHPKHPYFAFGALDGSVWCYQIDQESQTLVQLMSGFSHSMECNGGVFVNVDSSNDQELSLVTISEDGVVVNWNCFTGGINYRLLPEDQFKNVESPWVSITQYKQLIAIGGRDGQLSVINNDTGKIVFSTKVLENSEDEADLSIEAIAWCQAPLVNLLAVGLVSGDLLLFDTLQWKLRTSVNVDDAITKLTFLTNLPVLVGSSMDGKLYVWDARTGQEKFVGVGHNMGVLDFAILENGRKIATAGDEGVSLIFNVPL